MPSKSVKKHLPKKKLQRQRKGTKKQKGGVSFNAPISLDTISNYTYPYNMRTDDPQAPNMVTDARILNCSTAENANIYGGKKSKQSRRKGASKNTKKRRSKKQKGGSLNYSLLPDTCKTNDVLAFGSSGGSEYIKNTILAEAPNCNKMTSASAITTLA